MVVNAKSCRLRCCQVYGEPFFCTSHVLVPQTLHSEDDFSQVRKNDFSLPKVLAGALKARKNDIPVKTLLTICKGREGTELSDGDVGLKESDINSFVDEVVVNRKLWSAGVQDTMTGSHVFVCSHSSQDKRCGFCGPILIKKFKEEAELRELDNVYGYVTPSDVPELLDNHIVKGEIIDRIWRF
ncbi:putative thioredoxin-like ferredoxin, Thioredoxin-like superfamily [Helianthus anomalus]